MIQKLFITIILFINRFIPKHEINNRVLVFCDMGIGDLIMLLPLLKYLQENEFELSFSTRKQVNRDILKLHFPSSAIGVTGKYGYSLNNFHTVYWREILEILLNRIPKRIAHDHYLYSKFFNECVSFEKGKEYQPIQNMQLCKPFGLPLITPILFFNSSSEYILIQPFSHTDRRKECMNIKHILTLHPNEVIIAIGHKKEYRELDNRIINLIGQSAMIELSFLIKRAKHFYCLEFGLAHISAALGTPTTVYYRESITRKDYIHTNLKHMQYEKSDSNNTNI